MALNTVVAGLVSSGFIQRGDVVLTTNQEHAGGIAGWAHIQAQGLISLVVVDLPVPDFRSTSGVVSQFESAITSNPRTKVLAISHVLTTSGTTLPIVEIVAMARKHNVRVVVDGAQAFGTEVNATALGVDVYASSAHKWLLAPTGNGIMCIRSEFQKYVNATEFDGGYGIYTRAAGTRAAFPTLGLGYSISYIESFGRQAVVDYCQTLAASAWTQLANLGLVMLSPAPIKGSAPIVSFALPDPFTAPAVGSTLLNSYGIVVKMTGRAQFPDEWPVGTVAHFLISLQLLLFLCKCFIVKLLVSEPPAGFPFLGAPEQALRLTFHLFNSQSDVGQPFASIFFSQSSCSLYVDIIYL